MNHSYYKSGGGIAPYIVGGAAAVFGAMSVLMAAMPSTPSIIETGAGEGMNAIVSGITTVAGVIIWKKKDTFTAVLGGALIVSLLVYGQYRVDTSRALDVASAAGSAAMNAATAATNAAANSANRSYYQYAPQQTAPKGQYRHLTPAELSECNTGAKWTKSEAGQRNCSTKMCDIATCGGG